MRASRVPDALNTICPYYTMFPVEFPLHQLRSARRNDVVLDPFCGRGTTIYAARKLRLRAVGVDSNPVAVAIAQAKLASVTPHEVVQAATKIVSCQRAAGVPLQGEFWKRCFDSDVLRTLCVIRNALIENCATPARMALRAVILGALHGPRNKGVPSYFSNQMPRTFAAKPRYAVKFWKRRRLRPPSVDVLALIRRRAEYYFKDVPALVEGEVHCADSREFVAPQHLRASWIITSPPYYGMRMYIPDQWLRYWFVGGPSEVKYSSETQLAHTSPEEFADQLSEVWENVGRNAVPGARMVVRFGGIHDRNVDPVEILRSSVTSTECGWRLVTIRSAGLATSGKRQAQQFKRRLLEPMEEYDFFLRLDS